MGNVVNEKDCGELWKERMEKILNVENEWDQMVEADVVEGLVGVTYEEVMKAMNEMKVGKAAGPSEVNMNMIMASGKFSVIIKKVCQRILDGEDWPEEWKTSVVVPIFIENGDVMDCEAYLEVMLLEHAMKTVERVLENRIRVLVARDDMQFGFMPRKVTIHTLFILRRIQEEVRGKEKKLDMCFVNLEKAFDRVLNTLIEVAEWALKKSITRSVGASSDEFILGFKDECPGCIRFVGGIRVNVGVHQESELSPLIFAIVVGVVTKDAREVS